MLFFFLHFSPLHRSFAAPRQQCSIKAHGRVNSATYVLRQQRYSLTDFTRGRDTVVVCWRSHKFQSRPTGAGAGARARLTRRPAVVSKDLLWCRWRVYDLPAARAFYLHRVTARAHPCSTGLVSVIDDRPSPSNTNARPTRTHVIGLPYKSTARFQSVIYMYYRR